MLSLKRRSWHLEAQPATLAAPGPDGDSAALNIPDMHNQALVSMQVTEFCNYFNGIPAHAKQHTCIASQPHYKATLQLQWTAKLTVVGFVPVSQGRPAGLDKPESLEANILGSISTSPDHNHMSLL